MQRDGEDLEMMRERERGAQKNTRIPLILGM